MPSWADPNIQRVKKLGRPATHDDLIPVPIRQYFENIAVRSRGWNAPQGMHPTPAIARLDAGRWLADCPLGCHGAELVSEKDPVFFCLSCGSEGKYHPVLFPRHKKSIDAEVKKRDDAHAWAWRPGETLVMLRAETKRLAD